MSAATPSGPNADELGNQGAPAARVARLIEALDAVDERAGAALELGVLAEGDDPDTRAAVRRGVERYVAVLERARGDEPSRLALVFLLAHFPEDRERILAVVESASLDPDDFARLERCLARVEVPARRLGRVWPSPATWADDDAHDGGWVRSLELTADAAARLWDLETQALLAYSGAKARYAIDRR